MVGKRVLWMLFLWGISFGVYAGEEHAHEKKEKSHAHEEKEKGHAHEEEETLEIKESWKKEFGIRISRAKGGYIVKEISLPGEVKLPVDKIAHVVTPVSGIVVRTYRKIGDRVYKGDLLAIIRSRELAMVKSDYLIALEKYRIAKQNYDREKALWEKGISPQREYLEAKREWETARILVKSAEQKLLSIGLTREDIQKIPQEKEIALYRIKSPKRGVIVEKHAVEGEFKNTGDNLFKIINTSLIWIDFSVWQEYLPWIKVGGRIELIIRGRKLRGRITWVSPTLDPRTRTAIARVELRNDGSLKPATFVTGRIRIRIPARVVVPQEAVVRIKDEFFVFVAKGNKFLPRKVRVGKEGEEKVEILSGLRPGERFVSKGAFFLKSEILKEEFSGGGHAH